MLAKDIPVVNKATKTGIMQTISNAGAEPHRQYLQRKCRTWCQIYVIKGEIFGTQ